MPLVFGGASETPGNGSIDNSGPTIFGCDHATIQAAIRDVYEDLINKGGLSDAFDESELFHLRTVLMRNLMVPYENVIRDYGPLANSSNNSLRRLLNQEMQGLEAAFAHSMSRGVDADKQDYKHLSLGRHAFTLDNLLRLGDSCLFAYGFHGIDTFEGADLNKLGKQAYRKGVDAFEDIFNIRVTQDDPSGERPSIDTRMLKTVRKQKGFFDQCFNHFDEYAEVLGGVSEKVLSFWNEPAREDKHTSYPVPAFIHKVDSVQDNYPAKLKKSREANAMPRGHEGKGLEDYIGTLLRQVLLQGVDMREFRDRLNSVVVGQPQAVDTMADNLVMLALGVKNPKTPPNIFAVGYTGNGKNHLFEKTAEIIGTLTGLDVAFRDVHMSGYQGEGAVNQLFGAHKGYVGYDQEAIFPAFYREMKRNAFGIMVMDEIEKASNSIIQALLPLLDKGYVYDTHENKLDFSGTMIGFTSNIGYSGLKDKGMHTIGFSNDGEQAEEIAKWDTVKGKMRERFSPEFLNRVHVVRFSRLTENHINMIYDLELDAIASRYEREHGLEVHATYAAREHVLSSCDTRRYGARNVSNTLERMVNVPLGHTLHSAISFDEDGRTEMLAYLQHLKEEGADVDKDTVYKHVMEKMAPESPYSTAVIDVVDNELKVKLI